MRCVNLVEGDQFGCEFVMVGGNVSGLVVEIIVESFNLGRKNKREIWLCVIQGELGVNKDD